MSSTPRFLTLQCQCRPCGFDLATVVGCPPNEIPGCCGKKSKKLNNISLSRLALATLCSYRPVTVKHGCQLRATGDWNTNPNHYHFAFTTDGQLLSHLTSWTVLLLTFRGRSSTVLTLL